MPHKDPEVRRFFQDLIGAQDLETWQSTVSEERYGFRFDWRRDPEDKVYSTRITWTHFDPMIGSHQTHDDRIPAWRIVLVPNESD